MFMLIVSTVVLGFFLLLLYFHCLARERQSRLRSERQKRDVKYNKAPVFTTTMAEHQEALSGSVKKFECQVAAYPLPEIRWFKDNIDITNSPRYKFAYRNGICSCLIEDIVPRDQGLFKCEAVNSEGVASTSAYLLVRDRSELVNGNEQHESEDLLEQEKSTSNYDRETFEERLTKQDDNPEIGGTICDSDEASKETDLKRRKDEQEKEEEKQKQNKEYKDTGIDGNKETLELKGSLEIKESVGTEANVIEHEYEEETQAVATEAATVQSISGTQNDGEVNEDHEVTDNEYTKDGTNGYRKDKANCQDENISEKDDNLRHEEHKQAQKLADVEADEHENLEKVKCQEDQEDETMDDDKKKSWVSENQRKESEKDNGRRNEDADVGEMIEKLNGGTKLKSADKNVDVEYADNTRVADVLDVTDGRFDESTGDKNSENDKLDDEKGNYPENGIYDSIHVENDNENNVDDVLGGGNNGIEKVNEQEGNPHPKTEKSIDDAADVSITVDSVKPPEFIKKPEDLVVNEGENITIDCIISGIPSPEVLWFKSGEPLKSDDKHIISGADQIHKLEVRNASVEDSGEYAVAAINSEGKIYFNLNVDVTGKNIQESKEEKEDEESDLKPPEFTFKPSSMTATEFDPVQIFCQASGHPPPVVTWYKGGKPLRSGGNINMFNEDESHYLVILKSSLLDAGEYTCTASNEAGAVFFTLKLTIEGLTEVESSTSTDVDSSTMDKLKPKIAAELERIADESTDEELLREYVLNTKYTDRAKSICLSEGEVVELLDKSVPTAWLVRVQNDKESICSIPPNLLTPKEDLIQKVKTTAEELVPPGKDLQAPLSPGQNEMRRRGKLSRSPSKKQSSTEQDSSDDEDKLGKIEAYPVYVVVADFVPDDTRFDFLPLTEGQFVHVCDSKNIEHWLSKTKPSKLNPSKEGWISPSYVEKKEGLGFADKRTSKEVFREDVIQCTNKKQESLIKRRYALTELLEAERDYIKELALIIENYAPIFEDKNIPESLQGRKDLIMTNLSDIYRFHNDVFLSELMNCTSDPGTIGETFLAREDKFEEYIAFLKCRPEADLLLTLSSNTSYLKEYKRKNKLDKSLFQHLDAPAKYLQKTESLLKDFLRYSSRAKADNKALIQAIAMLARICKTSDDKVHLENIGGYPGDLDALGAVVRHDDFSQWDADASGRGKDRHCFLFKDKLLITKPKRVDDPMDLPAYIFKGVVDLANVQINELVLDEEKFELWYAQPNCEKLTFEARDIYAKKAWVYDIRDNLKELGIEETDLPLEKVPDIDKPKPNKSSPPAVKRKPSQDSTAKKLAKDSEDNEPSEHGGEFTTTDTESKHYVTAGDEESETYLTAPEADEGYAKPIILKRPDVIQVKDGDEAVFECTLIGHPSPSITWLKDDVPIDEKSTRYEQAKSEGDEYRLKITETTVEDAGVYTIRASNDFGTIECSADLTVTRAEEKKPTFIEAPKKSYEAVVGSEFKVSTKIESNPKSVVKWIKDGKEIQPNDHIKIVNEGDQHLLIIPTAEVKDSGTYTIKVKNNLRQIEAKMEVKIKEEEASPKIIEEPAKKLEVETGSDVKVSANISSNPKPDVKWLKDGKEIKPSNRIKFMKDGDEYSLVIPSAQVEDNATYTIQATNELGNSEATTVVEIKEKEVAPKLVKGPSKKLDSETGAEVRITANISSNPKLDVKWLKDGNEIKPSDRIKFKNNGDDYSLVIPSAEVKDSATYTIQGKNKLGQVEAKTDVKIKEKETAPHIVKEPSNKLEVEAGSGVKITAHISSNPKPDMKWLKDGTEIKPNERIKFTNDGDEYSLIIPIAEVKDSATYTIQGKNKLGKVEAKTSVQIKEKEMAPNLTKEPVKKLEVEAGSAVKITSKISSNPKPEVTWLRDGKEINPSDRIKIINEGDEYSLVIPSAEPKDSATYSLQAKNKLGKVETKSDVEIKEKEVPPHIDKEPTKKLETEAGSDVKLTTRISSNPKPEVKWMKNGKEIKPSDRIKFTNDGDEYSLVISAADVNDSATYTIQTKNKLGKAEAKSLVKINVKEIEPKFIEKPKSTQEVTAGSEVKVAAKISSNPKPEIKWLKDGKELQPNDRIKFINEGDDYALIIPIAEVIDSATYTIQGKNKLGKVEAKTRVEIKEKEAPPNITKEPVKTLELEAGTDVKITANITSNPKPDIKWLKDGKQIKPNERIKFTKAGDDYSLTISASEKRDSATYKLLAKNKLGEVEATTELKINEKEQKPQLSIKPNDALEAGTGSEVKINAKISSNPKPDVKWLKDGKELKPNDRIKFINDGDEYSLVIPSAEPNDSATYTIEVKNRLGKVESRTKVVVKEEEAAPKIIEGPAKKLEVDTGSDFKVSANISSNPKPDVKWLKDGKEIKPSDRVKFINEGDEYSLVISSAQVKDNATYTIQANNKLGKGEATTNVKIKENKSPKQGPPKFKEKLENTVSIEGVPLTLEVKVSANPEPAITWFVDGHKLKPSEDITLTYDGETAILTIKETFPEDTGRYSCRAVNALGESETEADIIIEEIPREKATSAPKLWIPLEDVKIKEKKVACFECSVSSSTSPEIIWLYNDEQLDASSRIEMYEDGDFIGINIVCAAAEDSGKYTCIVRNKAGEVSSSAELFVECVKKEIVGYAPLITWRLKDQEAFTRESVRFDCRFTADPEPVIKWFKDGKELKTNKKYAVEQNDGNFALIVHDLASEDEGIYEATVTNPLGTVSCSAALIVDEAPREKKELSPEPGTVLLRRDSVSPESRKILRAEAKEKEKQKTKSKKGTSGKSKLESAMKIEGYSEKKSEKEENEEYLDKADTGVPLAPRAINEAPAVHDLTEDSLNLSWPESVMPSYAKQVPIMYDVEVREPPGKGWKTVVKNLDDTVYHIAGMKPDQEYMYRIRAVNDLGLSEPSLSTVVRKRAGPPDMPSGMPNFKELGTEEIELSWKKATVPKGHLNTDIAYNVEYREPPSKEWKILASNVKDSHLKTAMHPSRDYQVKVTALNLWGMSEPTMAVMIPRRDDKFMPEMPRTKPQCEMKDANSFILEWEAARLPPGAPPGVNISYIIEGSEFPSYDFKPIATDLTDTRFTMHDLKEDRDYMFRVLAATKYAVSDPSPSVSVHRKPAKNAPIPPKEIPTMSAVGPDAIYLSWHPAYLSTGVDTGITYNVYQRELPSEEWHKIANELPDTACTVRGLHPDTDYMFRIYGVNVYGISDPYPPFALYQKSGYDDVARKQPESVNIKPKVEELDGDSIRLTWPASKPPGGAKAPVWYTVEESEPNTNNWRKVAEKVDDTTYVISDLNNDRDYSFRVRAENDYGTSDPSPSINVFRTGAPKILPVAVQEKPSISVVDPATLKLSWWAPYSRTIEAEPLSYAIEVNNSGSRDGPWDVIACGIKDTKFILHDIDPNMEYMFRIVSENDAGISRPSPEVKFKQNLDSFLPGAVREKPHLSDIDPTSVRLSWIPPYTSSRAPPPTSYRLEMSNSPDSGWKTVVDGITEPSFTLNDLRPDKPYFFRIVSQNDYGHSNPSPSAKVYKKSSSFLPDGIMDKPRITETKPTSCRVLWLPPRMSPSAPSYSYTVECREGHNGKWERIASGLDERVTSFTAVDLRPETDYAFRIIVENSYGSSEPSPVAMRPASMDLVPSGIKGKLSMKDLSPSSIQLHWDKPRVPPIGEYSYVIEYRDPHTKEWKQLVGDISDQNYVIDNLRPDLDYMYRIVVQNEYGRSNPSPTVTRYGEHGALLPNMPKDKPTIKELGPSAIELSWKEAKFKEMDSDVTYIIEMKDGSSGHWKEHQTDLKDTKFKISSLGYDKDYMFRVRAKNQHGISDPTHSVTAHRSKSAHFPDRIHDNPQLSILSPDSAVLSWSVPSQPSHLRDLPFMYVIEAREHPSREWMEIAQDIEDPSFDLNELSRDKEYSFRVLVENEYGLSEPSPSVTLSRKEGDYIPQTARDRPKLSDVKAETVTLGWEEIERPPMATDCPVTYVIEARDAQYNWKTYQDDIIDTSLVVKAAPDIEHAFRIRAKNTFGLSDPSRQLTVPKRQVFPDPIPDKPFLMELTSDTVKISWRSPRAAFISDLPSSAYTYVLEYRQPPSDNWKKLIGGLKETSFTIRDLEKDKEYMFRVRTQNDFGISDPSLPVSRAKLPDHAAIRRTRSRSREPSPWRLPSDLNTDVAPEFTNMDQNIVYGVQGQSVKLNASLKAYPEPKIMWYHNEDKVDLGVRCNAYKSANGLYSLEIEKMTSSDVGVYKIYAENSQGMAEFIFKLELADPPIFIEPLKNTNLRVWSYGKLDCRIDGLPYPEVKFFKDWRPLTQTARVKTSRTEYDHWSLSFDSTIFLDEGMYICVAENIAGKTHCVVNLVIEEKPPLIDVKFKPTHISDFYYVLDEIARGSHGVVRRVVEKSTGIEFAAKFLRARDENQKNDLKREGDVMALLSHRHVVRLTDAYEMKKNIVLVTEMLTGEELLDYIINKDKLTESEVAYYIRQVLEALQHSHSKGVVHLDVKPENLRLFTPGADDNIKLIDFGFSHRIYKNKETFVDLGTPEFVSPEILRQEPVTHSADTWSVGVLTYILLSGISPFLASSERETLQRIRDSQWTFDETAFENITDEAKDFINKLLVLQPKSRMTVKQCFEHPWLQVSEQRGQGIKINTERHKVYNSRRKFECSLNQVKTIVFHRKMTLLMAQLPKLQLPSIEIFEEPDESHHPQSRNTLSPSFNGLMPGSPTGIVLTPGTSRASSVEPSEYGDSDSFTDRDAEGECPMEDWLHQYGPKPSYNPKHKLDELEFDDFFEKPLGVRKPLNQAPAAGKKRMRKISFTNEPPPVTDPVEAPVFKETIKDKAYDVGENVTLHCQVIGRPIPTVYWYRNDEPLWDGERIRIEHSKDTGHTSLTILNTLPHDYGVYKCVASSAGTRVVTKGRLFLGDVPGRPGRPVVHQVSTSQALIIWEEPEHDGNGNILNYRVDYRKHVDHDKWTIATYTIDECALISDLLPNTIYRFRVCGRNRFGVSPYSWASIEVRTKPNGSPKIKMDRETKRIILRSQRARIDDSDDDDEDDVTPTASRKGSMPQSTVNLQETDPTKFYDIEGQIEGGHFNVVVNCRSKTKNKEYIAKILGYTADTEDSILREYHILKAVNHHRIVQLYEAYITDKQLVLIFEKLQGEEVTRAMSFKTRYNEETVCRIIRQVLAAVQYLHSYGIVHLNIQPGNIMMVSRRRLDLKVIDFTCARAVNDEEGERFGKLGMPEFMAPEMVTSDLVGCAADIWNVGVLTFILLSGESPFLGGDDESTFENVVRLRYDADQLYGHITKDALKFMYNLLKVNPRERLSLDDCVESRWVSLSENMVKRRRANKFITSKLRHFQEVYTARRRAQGKPSEELLGSYAHIKRASSVDSDTECDITCT